MRIARTLALIGLLAVAVVPATAQDRGHPSWSPSIEKGLAEAKTRGVALMVAINMDNERGNQQMVDDVYSSKKFHDAAKSCVIAMGSLFKHPGKAMTGGKTVCARFGSVTCVEHQAIESTVRQDWLKRGPHDDIESPRHFFLAPNGKILFQKVWTMSASELSELMKRASELCTPEKIEAWDTLEGRLERAADPISSVRDIALADLIAENDAAIVDQLVKLAKSSKDPNVPGSIYAAFVGAEDEARRQLGAAALTHKMPEVRMRVAWAMQKSGAVEHLKPLVARVGKERDAKAKGSMYRAIGALAAESQDKGAKKALVKGAGNSKDPARAHAALSIAPWAKEKDVKAALQKILVQGGATDLRSAAVWSLGFSEDKEVRGELVTFKESLSRREWRLDRVVKAAISRLRGIGEEGYDAIGARILKHPAEADEEEDEKKRPWER